VGVGLWWVAILVHAFNNSVAMALSVGSEWRRRRHPSFPHGDECTVTVDDYCPPYKWHGMCQASTQAGEALLVAGLEPG
jgi:hypothetical protein